MSKLLISCLVQKIFSALQIARSRIKKEEIDEKASEKASHLSWSLAITRKYGVAPKPFSVRPHCPPLFPPLSPPIQCLPDETWFRLLNSFNTMGSGGNKKLPPCSFSTVGIVWEFCQASTQLPTQTSSPWCSVCPPYGVDSMNRPNLTREAILRVWPRALRWGFI